MGIIILIILFPMSWPKLFAIAASGKQEESLSKYDIDLYKKTSLLSSSLHFAVLGRNFKTISYIINSGVNINSRNLYGETPLHWCCKEGNRNCKHINRTWCKT